MSTSQTPSPSTADRSQRDTLTTAALRTLDPAPAAPLTAEEQSRADGLLERILAQEPRDTPVPRRRGPRRAVPRVLVLAAAAVALALVVSATGVLGGGTAYASWTARPTVLPVAEQEDLARQCREYLSPVPGAGGEGIPTEADVQAARLVLADSRGAWSYVVLSGDGGFEATCLVEEARGIRRLLPGVSSAAASYGFLTPPTPASDAIVGTGLMSMSTDEGSAWSTEGHVGGDVAAVTVLTGSGTEVQATVTQGRFAAWWPERLTVDESRGLEGVRYVVSLRDGTVLPAQTYDEIAPVPVEE